ncbi:unnamed protein product, partial [Adineta steineri]
MVDRARISSKQQTSTNTSFGQQYAFSRVYLNIPNRQDLIIFTEKFQGYVFVDKNGNEYPCTVEYA